MTTNLRTGPNVTADDVCRHEYQRRTLLLFSASWLEACSFFLSSAIINTASASISHNRPLGNTSFTNTKSADSKNQDYGPEIRMRPRSNAGILGPPNRAGALSTSMWIYIF